MMVQITTIDIYFLRAYLIMNGQVQPRDVRLFIDKIASIRTHITINITWRQNYFATSLGIATREVSFNGGQPARIPAQFDHVAAAK